MAVLLFGGILAYQNRGFFKGPREDALASSPDWKEQLKEEDLGKKNVIEQLYPDELLFLILGADNGYLDPSVKGTDAVILAKVNYEKGLVDLVTIPRDSRMAVNGIPDKICNAHALGGVGLTMKSLRDYLGLDIDYYVKIDQVVFPELIDALGGVELDLTPQQARALNVKAGVRHLNGEQALIAERVRMGYEDGDLGRARGHQAFLKVILKEMLKPENLPKLPTMAATVLKYVDTNLPEEVIDDWLAWIPNFKDPQVDSYVFPGHYEKIDGYTYYVMDEAGKEKLVDEVFGKYRLEEGF